MKAPHVLRWVAADAFVTGTVRPVPTILRFARDDFMDQMLRTLAQQPQTLPALVAGDETGWRAEAATPPAPPDAQLGGMSRLARTLKRRAALQGFDAAAQAVATRAPDDAPIKLFQPVHQRYYLAAAHLVCERPGLPPRLAGSGDRSGFVVRQRIGGVEHGFVKGADGVGRWVPAADAGGALVARGGEVEELLPLFPLGYAPPAGPPRTLLAGLVPVARHDEYAFAPRAGAADAADPVPLPSVAERWKALAVVQVLSPWQALIDRAAQAAASVGVDAALSDGAPWDGDRKPDRAGRVLPTLREANTQLVEGSWRVLLSLREWLDAALPDLAGRLDGARPPTAPKARALWDLLDGARWPHPLTPEFTDALPTGIAAMPGAGGHFGWSSLRAALAAITGPDAGAARIDDAERALAPPAPGETPFPWPASAFPLALAQAPAPPATPTVATPLSAWPEYAVDGRAGIPLPTQQLDALAQGHDKRLVTLLQALHGALDEAGARPGTASPQAPAAAELAKSLAQQDADTPADYVLRFVHLRCDCGPKAAPVISAPSAPFRLAGFFDPDAPLRPIRIALPFDTSPGGLRRYGQNSAFIVSDLLCGQMKRVRKLGFGDLVLSVLPWPFHKDLDLKDQTGCAAGGNRFGMICSLSIPIITLVAFVLLIVIATLLDLVFRWMPFLMACFPVPGLKGKRK